MRSERLTALVLGDEFHSLRALKSLFAWVGIPVALLDLKAERLLRGVLPSHEGSRLGREFRPESGPAQSSVVRFGPRFILRAKLSDTTSRLSSDAEGTGHCHGDRSHD